MTWKHVNRIEAHCSNPAWPEALQSFLFGTSVDNGGIICINMTISHHLISQAGWNRCRFSLSRSHSLSHIKPKLVILFTCEIISKVIHRVEVHQILE